MSRTRIAAVALTMAAILAACGGDDTTPSAGGTSPGADGTSPAPGPTVNDQGTLDVTADGKLTLELDDRYFKPTFIKAKPGQSINVELENEGMLPHNFSITALTIDENVQPGGKVERTFTLPMSGQVDFFCTFHADAGMRGAFFFGASPSATGESTSESRY